MLGVADSAVGLSRVDYDPALSWVSGVVCTCAFTLSFPLVGFHPAQSVLDFPSLFFFFSFFSLLWLDTTVFLFYLRGASLE